VIEGSLEFVASQEDEQVVFTYLTNMNVTTWIEYKLLKGEDTNTSQASQGQQGVGEDDAEDGFALSKNSSSGTDHTLALEISLDELNFEKHYQFRIKIVDEAQNVTYYEPRYIYFSTPTMPEITLDAETPTVITEGDDPITATVDYTYKGEEKSADFEVVEGINDLVITEFTLGGYQNDHHFQIVVDRIPPALDSLVTENVGSNDANFLFSTNELTQAKILYRPQGSTGPWLESPLSELSADHNIYVYDLETDQVYDYSIIITDKYGHETIIDDLTFETDSGAENPPAIVGGSLEVKPSDDFLTMAFNTTKEARAKIILTKVESGAVVRCDLSTEYMDEHFYCYHYNHLQA
jgi:hypothetical protein